MDIRTPHDVTVMRNTGTTAAPVWEHFHLEGVKVDAITGKMARDNGYSQDDTMRLLVYLEDVRPSVEDWAISRGDYFTDDLCTPPATPGEWKKANPRVWQVTQIRPRTALAPVLRHLEITGR